MSIVYLERLLLTFFLIIIAYGVYNFKRIKQSYTQLIIIGLLVFILVALTQHVVATTVEAKRKGMTLYDKNHMTYGELIINNQHGYYTKTPKTKPLHAKGNIVLLVKYGHVDCNTIQKDLQNIIDKEQDIYILSKNSKRGQELFEQTKLQTLPAMIYFKNNATPLTYSLCLFDNRGNASLNEQQIKQILQDRQLK